MKLEDVLKALEALENGEELINVVKAELNKKNNEAKNLRTRAKTAEDALSEHKKTLAIVLEKMGIEGFDSDEFDLDDALEAYDTAMKAKEGGKGKGKDDPEFAELQRQVAKLTKTMDTLKKEKEAADKAVLDEQAKRHSMLVQTELLSSLTEGKAIKANVLVDVLKKFIKVGEDEKLVFTTDVGDEVSVKDGVAGWLKANPEFVENTSRGGAGSHGGPGGAGKTEEEAAKSMAEQRNKGPQNNNIGLDPWGGSSTGAK